MLGSALLLSLPSSAQSSSAPIGELFASETTAQGPALLAGTGMSVISGSHASAGKSPATLRLNRGGEIKICPRSSMTLNAVPQNDGLMLAINSSAVELNYPLNSVADTLITPDLTLMLAGPGVFHFAVGVSSQGDTCIKPLRGNSSSIIVREMLGTGIYQVKPDEAVLFAGGKVDGHAALISECGCPASPPTVVAENATAENKNVPAENKPVTPASVPALPADQPGEVHVKVDAPLVFHGDQPVPDTYSVAKVRFSTLPNVFSLQEKVEPTVPPENKGEVSVKSREKKGFFGRIKGFFGSLFKK